VLFFWWFWKGFVGTGAINFDQKLVTTLSKQTNYPSFASLELALRRRLPSLLFF